jgi:hypothetical protein
MQHAYCGEQIKRGHEAVVKCHSLESSYAHQTGDLADGDGDGGTGHETAYGRSGDELDDPTESQKAYAKDDEPLWQRMRGLVQKRRAGTHRDESDGCGDLWASPFVGVGMLYMFNDLSYGQGHDSHGADRHILGSGEELGRGLMR